MESVDLNIDNYEFDDLLNLFNLDYNFEEEELKNVKMIVLKTHPDKSNLDKKYFLFFMKAYKMLSEIYYFRGKSKKNRNTEYILDENEGNLELLKGLDGKSIKEFNNWFNKMFENVKLKDEEMDNGYGEWLEKGELESTENVKLSDFGIEFEKRKKRAKEITVYKNVEELYNNSGSNLLNERPELYNSNIFSKLKYEDLKRAHTETVVPVCEEDFNKIEKFNNVDEYLKHRARNEGKPLNMRESRNYLKKKDNETNKSSMRRAYKLIKREEEMEKAQENWWKNFKRLKR